MASGQNVVQALQYQRSVSRVSVKFGLDKLKCRCSKIPVQRDHQSSKNDFSDRHLRKMSGQC